jgi:uracil-DNA glycosylase family 4
VTRTLAEVAVAASDSTKCRLANGRTHVVFGVGDADADVMFIGEAPGFHEDKQGEPFVGAAGQLLTRMLDEILSVARHDVYIANVIKCRPPGNRDPQEDEIESCTPWLVEQVSLIQPRVIVTLGNFATKFVLQFRDDFELVRETLATLNRETAAPQPVAVKEPVVVPEAEPAPEEQLELF